MSFANLVELAEASCAQFAGRPLFGTRRDGRWHWITYAEFQGLVDAFRGGLAALGVDRGDRVAIIANNRVEWAVAAYATYGLEATFVPMYEAQLAADWRFILADCGAKVVIASTPAIVAALETLKPALPGLEHIVALEGTEGVSYAALLVRGRAAPVPSRSPAPESVAGFLYTSGTTGKPKGVVLTHRNLASNVAAATDVFPISPDDRTLSFLPWAHAYGQVVELHILVSQGASTAFNDELPRLLENLAEVKPTILVAVPRVFNKIYQAVVMQLDARPSPIRWLFARGMGAGRRRNHGQRNPLGARLALWLSDRLIFAKVRARFGGRLRYAITASAALSPEVGEFIDTLGILLEHLLRGVPDATIPPRAPHEDAHPSRLALLGAELTHRAHGLRALPSSLPGTPRTLVPALARLLARGLRRSPDVGLNPRRVSPDRVIARLTFDLEEVKALKRRLGVTVNDVVLAVATGAMRRFLARRGVDPNAVHDFRAMAPASTHPAGDRALSGSRVALLLVPLPLDEPDPLRRVARIHEATGKGKTADHEAEAGELLVRISDVTVPAILPNVLRLALAQRGFHMIVTNVPGPPFPLYLLGAHLRGFHAIVNLWPRQALGMALMSYEGRLALCLQADRTVIPDLAPLVADLEASFAELRG